MMEDQKSYFVYFAVLSVNCISFSTGGAYSWPSPVLPQLNGKINPQDNPLPRPITTFEESWISALVNVGALIGPFIAGLMSDRLGRKKTLLAFSVPMIASHLICAFANTVELFFIARFILGLGVGCVFSVVPNYIGEISEDRNRGTLACLMPLMCATGIMYNYVIGPFVNIRMLSFLNLIPFFLFIVTFGGFIPESPYFFASIGDDERAQESLQKLRGKSATDVEKEFVYIKESVEMSRKNKGSIRDIFKSRALVKGLTVSCGLMVFNQFSGINAVLGYMQSIFDATGTSIPPEYSVIVVGFVQLLTTGATSQLTDRLGRRILLLISAVGSCISLCSMGLYFYLRSIGFDVSNLAWLPITSLLAYTVAFNLGLGPLPWTIMGELFPTNVKSLACTITSSLCMFLGFHISMFFPVMAEILGMAQSFWLFSICCGASLFFVIFIVPETKGKSLIEIQNILGGTPKK